MKPTANLLLDRKDLSLEQRLWQFEPRPEAGTGLPTMGSSSA